MAVSKEKILAVLVQTPEDALHYFGLFCPFCFFFGEGFWEGEGDETIKK